MPQKQGLGLNKESVELRPGDHPAEAGKESSIRRSPSRAGHLPTKDADLMAEYDDLNS